MTLRTTLLLGGAVLLTCACAPMAIGPEDAAGDERMKQAAERYTTCISDEAEKEVGNPAGVEDIAVAAHDRCWAAWEAYRSATSVAYNANAQTRQEKQLAHDRVDAHLRQFERDTRRAIMDRLVQRAMTKAK